MVIFVRMSKIQRKLFFAKLKKNTNLSWDTFYPKYKIGRTIFYHYLKGRFDIPEKLFFKWQKIAKIKLIGIKKIKKEKYLKKELPTIHLNNSFAEILGILNGDGHVSSLNYEVSVVGNAKELAYAFYLKNLFEKTIRLKFNLVFDDSKFKLRSYSINLFNLLTKEYGLPKGNKMGKLKIPAKIKYSRELLISYIRGLFDTDGTIYVRRKKEKVLEISSGDLKFLTEVHHLLNSFGFNTKLYKKHLSLYNQEEIVRFFNLVRPSNSKHIERFNMY